MVRLNKNKIKHHILLLYQNIFYSQIAWKNIKTPCNLSYNKKLLQITKLLLL